MMLPIPVRFLSIAAFVACAGFVATQCAHAQALAPSARDMRNSLSMSSRLANLEADNGKPFRLKARFTTFDYKGKPAGEGTLEETWLRPGRVRRVITFNGMTLTQVEAQGSVRTIGMSFEGSFMERRLVTALLRAIPSPASIRAAATVAYKPLQVGTATLECVLISPVRTPDSIVPATEAASLAQAARMSAAEAAKSAFCMDPESHILRVLQERFDVSFTYNKIARLGEHAIAQEIVVMQNGVQRGTLSVTSFVEAPELTDADFALPSNGSDLSVDDVELPATIVAARLLKKVQAYYPSDAKSQHISGTVVLNARIGPNGSLVELDPVSSPSPLLTESAIAAVKQWRYQPYLVNGVPTSVETTIDVTYTLGP